MTITTLTSREFNEDRGLARKAAEKGPVVITNHGRPAFVLLAFEDYRRLTESKTGRNNIIDMLGMPGAEDVELEISPARDPAQPADLT